MGESVQEIINYIILLHCRNGIGIFPQSIIVAQLARSSLENIGIQSPKIVCKKTNKIESSEHLPSHLPRNAKCLFHSKGKYSNENCQPFPPCPPSIYPWSLRYPETCILLCPAVVLKRYCSSLSCGRELCDPCSPSTGLPPLRRSRWETWDIKMFSLSYTRLSGPSLHKLLGFFYSLQYQDSKSGKLNFEIISGFVTKKKRKRIHKQ